MKITATFFAILLFWGLQEVRAQETIEISAQDKAIVAEQLEEEALSGKHDKKTNKFLNNIAKVFKNSKKSSVVDLNRTDEDCVNCSEQKPKNFFTKLGRTLGKGAAWITTTTAKPFISAASFITGAVEKGDKNQDIVALYKFFLNHQKEFDDLYLQAGTPEEMVELMLVQMESIMEQKTRTIMQDFLAHLGVDKEIPADLSDFELTAAEIARIDQSKISADFINNHPEYKEVKPLIGEMTNEEVMDIIESGYFDKAISFENYKEAMPKPHELVVTLVSQIFVPKIALGVVSSTLAGLYVAPVVISQLGTAASVAVCLQNETKAKFKNDNDLKMFCSYVTNKSSYELLKSRAKGYVAGKNFHQKVADKVAQAKSKRAEKRKQKELERQEGLNPVPELH